MEGRRAVIELLAAGKRRVHRLWLADGLESSPQLDEIERLASRQRVPVEVISAGGWPHRPAPMRRRAWLP